MPVRVPKEPMASFLPPEQVLQVPNSHFAPSAPVVMVWRTITAEVAKMREGQAEESLERDTFWYDRAEATRRAIELVADALQSEGLSPEVAEDLRWLHATLEIGEQFADRKSVV